MKMIHRRPARIGKSQGLANSVDIGCEPSQERSLTFPNERRRALRRCLKRCAFALDPWTERCGKAGIDVAGAGEGAFRPHQCNTAPLCARDHQVVATEAAEWADHIF